jgi:hypothetical protein
VESNNCISLDGNLVDQDIRKYIHYRLSFDRMLKKWGNDPEVAQEIETALMKGAQGM